MTIQQSFSLTNRRSLLSYLLAALFVIPLVLSRSAQSDPSGDNAIPPLSFAPHPISPGAWCANSLHVADINGDGRIDILPTATERGGGALWLENGGKDETDFIVHSFDYERPLYSTVCDLNADGRQDVLVTGGDGEGIMAWFENTGGPNPSFSKHIIIGYSNYDLFDVVPGDFDGDGDLDIFSELGLYLSDGGNPPSFFYAQGTRFLEFYRTAGADVDGDNDLDIVTSSDSGYPVWIENEAKPDLAFIERRIPLAIPYIHDIQHSGVADIDGDGDMDILTARDEDYPQMDWYENEGNGRFRPYILEEQPVSYFIVADIDGDGIADIVFSGPTGLRWSKIGKAQPDNWNGPIQISTYAVSDIPFSTIAAADMDNDGDTDIIAGSTDTIYLYENLTPPIGTPTPSPTPDTSPTPTLTPGPAEFDYNHDGIIDSLDLLLFQSHWHETSYQP